MLKEDDIFNYFYYYLPDIIFKFLTWTSSQLQNKRRRVQLEESIYQCAANGRQRSK